MNEAVQPNIGRLGVEKPATCHSESRLVGTQNDMPGLYAVSAQLQLQSSGSSTID